MTASGAGDRTDDRAASSDPAADPAAKRPLILLANDDGYAAPGLMLLREALLAFAEVVVCAPELNQSATSHSLSLNRSLRLRAVSPGIFALDGTPADCVYVALHSGDRVLSRRPDLVVSGMNHGLNLGVDVFYSGTVAAAREAALRGIPAIATSADHEADPAAAAQLSARIAKHVLAAIEAPQAAEWGGRPRIGPGAPSSTAGAFPPKRVGSLSGAVLLNVNIPRGDRWKVQGTRLGARLYDDDVIYRRDPRGREYLWIGGADVRHEPTPGSDTDAFDAGIASITPLSLDLFDPAASAIAAAAAIAAEG